MNPKSTMISLLFSDPLSFLILALALIVAISVHEFSHAFTAERLGDPTPRLQGRITLNPMAHLDMFGTLFILLVGFGWGKPVSFDPYNLKNPQRDSALISMAGPISNFIIALFCALLLRLFILFDMSIVDTIGGSVLTSFIGMNVLLGIFNLLPIHPLDGFKIVGGFLPRDKAREWYQLERYGIIFLIVLLIPFGRYSMLDYFIRPAIRFVTNLLIPGGTY